MEWNNRKYRDLYEKMTNEEKGIIDRIYDVVKEHCEEEGIVISYDDRAEDFIGAITKYLVESEPESK